MKTLILIIFIAFLFGASSPVEAADSTLAATPPMEGCLGGCEGYISCKKNKYFLVKILVSNDLLDFDPANGL